MTGTQVVLGFDYGERRIGVAVGQTLTAQANPLRVLSYQQQRPDWTAIGALISEWQPQALVVGLPLRADGSEGPIAQAAQRFSRQLAGRYQLPVHTIEETLSSVDASHRQRAAGQRGPVDAIAAQIILETWLTEYGST
jgi:putative Holliday junction resolvase